MVPFPKEVTELFHKRFPLPQALDHMLKEGKGSHEDSENDSL